MLPPKGGREGRREEGDRVDAQLPSLGARGSREQPYTSARESMVATSLDGKWDETRIRQTVTKSMIGCILKLSNESMFLAMPLPVLPPPINNQTNLYTLPKE